jgi:hypothetical protein
MAKKNKMLSIYSLDQNEMELDSNPLINDTRRVPISIKSSVKAAVKAIVTKPMRKATKASIKPPKATKKDKVSRVVEKKNETLKDMTTNVEDKPNPTDVHADAKNEATNEGELENVTRTKGSITIRPDIKQPRVPAKSRPTQQEPVNPIASIEALAELSEMGERYFESGMENQSRFNSLNNEPRPTNT